MKIYFCEKCGVSIPLQEVVGGRATARNGKTYCQGCQPDAVAVSGDLKLYFCDNCRVSIPLQDVITNRAKAVGEEMLCVDCGRLTDPQRNARRERIKRELKEKDENRYRLHFCDSCNTSIPQSHLITGRAVMRGGRTFCERCRGRAEGRRVSALGAVGVLLLLGVVFLAGYVILGSGGDLFAGETVADGPDPLKALEERLTRMEADLAEKASVRAREIEELRGALEALPALREAQTRLKDAVEDGGEQAGEILKAQGTLRAETEERLSRIDTVLRELTGKLAALTAQLEELKQAAPAAPPAPAPKEEPVPGPGETPKPPAPTPAPKVEDAPADVQALIRDLGDKDAGVRFSAAVELGKQGHKAAVLPLVAVLEKDTDVFVRRAATRSLGELSAWRAVPSLVAALEDKEFFVAITAHKALEAITGQDFGFKEGLSRSELKKVVTKAKDWWDEHQGDRVE